MVFAHAVHADGVESLGSAVAATTALIDARLRIESVHQEGMSNAAEAATLRMRLGFQTGKAWQTTLLVEGDFTTPLSARYDSTTNGEAGYPVVADPENYGINRLQLTNTSVPQTTVTVGRQRIVLDDQRFVGNVGWRQNEQTFDSVRIVNRAVSNVMIDVSYFDQVNRVFGADSPQGRYQGDCVLANVSYQSSIGKLTAFAYRLPFDPIPGVPAAARDSSTTRGARFSGERAIGTVRMGYAGSYASQTQEGDNPLSFRLNYYSGEASAAYRQYSIVGGIEVLEGNGVKGFTTPLATLHKFQGWADKFLATPVNGIEDRYVNATRTWQHAGTTENVSMLLSYHHFDADRISVHYGSEIDAQVQFKWQHYAATVKYASYNADHLFTDTEKFWMQVEYTW